MTTARDIQAAAAALIRDTHDRYPAEALRCLFLIAMAAARAKPTPTA